MFCAKTALIHFTQDSFNPTGLLTMMIGGKNFVQCSEQKYVSFKFSAKAANKANYVKITVNGTDGYDIEFGKISNRACPKMKEIGLKVMTPHYKELKTFPNLPVENLKSTFESETGLTLTKPVFANL